eukprot:12706605-Alexandrium_andersonii.AAC.1
MAPPCRVESSVLIHTCGAPIEVREAHRVFKQERCLSNAWPFAALALHGPRNENGDVRASLNNSERGPQATGTSTRSVRAAK